MKNQAQHLQISTGVSFNERGLLYFLIVVLTGALVLFYSQLAAADSPASLAGPDRHSVEVKGKISLYRVQIEGMNLGKNSDKADAEVFITLDKDPSVVYALDIHKDSPRSNQVIADTLREAYFNNRPVTIYHQIAPARKNNFKILMVQLSK